MLKSIGIIGAGFAGLSTCYHLLMQEKDLHVTVIDAAGIGGGASGIASGLLHPYPGEKARLSWRGKEAFFEAKALLERADPHAGKKGIFRFALSSDQEKEFQSLAANEEEIEWWDAERCQKEVPGAHALPGIFLHEGLTVEPALYLNSLWEVCKQLGAEFVCQKIKHPSSLGYDQIVLATGGDITSFKEAQSLSIKQVKGQLLTCKKPSFFKLNYSLIGKGYIANRGEESQCVLGSTYEHHYISQLPCKGLATDKIFSQMGQFFPSYGFFEVQDCRAGMRVARKGTYLPLIGKVKEKLWVFTALGSRGLLYHALMGKWLSQAILKDNPASIPMEVRI